jgi:molecular chaperone HscB
VTYFEALDLAKRLALDPKDLEKRFYAKSRELHPDRFARKSAAEQAAALDASAVLNDAYRTLRDPIARALYLLKLEGYDISEQGTKDVPPELLEEVFELNMALEEADTAQLDTSRRKFEEMRTALDAELEERFAAWDAGQSAEALNDIRGLLNRRKYITNLIGKANVPDRV